MEMPRRINFGWMAFVAICFVAALVALVMMYIAWDHNPELAFHEDGIVHWGTWLTIGFSWFVAIAGIPCVIAFVAVAASLFRLSRNAIAPPSNRTPQRKAPLRHPSDGDPTESYSTGWRDRPG